MRIFLIGFMACGKTTIGKKLAKKLGFTFIDLDDFIFQTYQKTVRQLFDEGGEAHFRSIERMALNEVIRFERVVVSTGGGTPCFYDNIQIIKQHGISVYLQMSAKGLARRLMAAKEDRPLVKEKTEDELIAYVADTLAQREQFYNQASMTIEATNPDVCALSDTICRKLNDWAF